MNTIEYIKQDLLLRMDDGTNHCNYYVKVEGNTSVSVAATTDILYVYLCDEIETIKLSDVFKDSQSYHVIYDLPEDKSVHVLILREDDGRVKDLFPQDKVDLLEHDLEIDIPFGARDSELQEFCYYIPEGFHAEVSGDRVLIKRDQTND